MGRRLRLDDGPYRPKYLNGVIPTAEAAAAVRCRECGHALCLTESGYLACGRAMSHGGLRPAATVAALIESVWPLIAKRKLLPVNVIRRTPSVLPPPDEVKEDVDG